MYAFPAAALVSLLLLSPVLTNAEMYGPNDGVENLTEENFEREVIELSDFWLVEFYAPWCGHCQKLAPEWKGAAKKITAEGLGRLGAVNCDEEGNKALCSKYDVKGFPTIKVFKPDSGGKPEDYSGAREEKDIVDFVKSNVGSGGSSKLVGEVPYLSVHSFLRMNLADKPKALLLLSGERVLPSWAPSLAVKYKSGKERSVVFGHTMCDREGSKQVAKAFGVETFPKLVVVMPADGDSPSYFVTASADGSAAKVVKDLKKFVETAVAGGSAEADRTEVPPFPEPDIPRKQADTSLYAATADNLESVCFGGANNKGGKALCILSLVNAPGGECKEMELLKSLSRRFRNDPVIFAWLDPAQQEDFVKAFGTTTDAVPQMLAVKGGKRSRFAFHEGAFTEEATRTFVDDILGGNKQFKVIKQLPEIDRMTDINFDE